MWDVNTNTELMQFEEHARRVWSIDFSRVVSSHMCGWWQTTRAIEESTSQHSGEFSYAPPLLVHCAGSDASDQRG